jgi:hypothetical protein
VSTAAVPIRDQWYLEQKPAQIGGEAASTGSVAKDRWYLGTARASVPPTSNVPPMRDQWYLEQSGVTSRGH